MGPMVGQDVREREPCVSRGIAFTAGLCVLGAGVLGTGCTKDDPNPTNLIDESSATVIGAEAKLHGVGERATARDYTMRILNVTDCRVEAHFRPPPGMAKVGVEVEIDGMSSKEVPINPFYATVATKDGSRFEATLAGCEPLLRATRVTRGEQARGWLSFDVPTAATRFTLAYEPIVIGVGREELLFDVRR